MSVIGKIVSSFLDTDLVTTSQFFLDFFGGRKTEAGALVSPETSLGLSAYYAGLRAISEDIAKLPLKVFLNVPPRGKRGLPDHPLTTLLNVSPNPIMNASAFRETMTHWALGWGGGFAEIQRNGAAVPVALWPIHPNRVRIRILPGNEGLQYRVIARDLQSEDVFLSQDEMFHIHGLGGLGVAGYTLSILAKEAIGLGLEAQKFGARFFGNGGRPSGVLTHPGKLKAAARQNLRESWNKDNQGSEAQGTALLEEGTKFEPISVPPEEAQFIATRQFEVEEIARWFRIPPHKIQHLLRSTFNNIAQQNIEYVVDTLLPWAVRWEQEIKRKLLMPSEKKVFAQHQFTSLLRGDQKMRAEFYTKLFNTGALSPDDIRELENLNPIPDGGGDRYFVGVNLQVIGSGESAPSITPQPPSGPPRTPEEQREMEVKAALEVAREEEIKEDATRRLPHLSHSATPQGSQNGDGHS